MQPGTSAQHLADHHHHNQQQQQQSSDQHHNHQQQQANEKAAVQAYANLFGPNGVPGAMGLQANPAASLFSSAAMSALHSQLAAANTSQHQFMNAAQGARTFQNPYQSLNHSHPFFAVAYAAAMSAARQHNQPTGSLMGSPNSSTAASNAPNQADRDSLAAASHAQLLAQQQRSSGNNGNLAPSSSQANSIEFAYQLFAKQAADAAAAASSNATHEDRRNRRQEDRARPAQNGRQQSERSRSNSPSIEGDSPRHESDVDPMEEDEEERDGFDGGELSDASRQAADDSDQEHSDGEERPLRRVSGSSESSKRGVRETGIDVDSVDEREAAGLIVDDPAAGRHQKSGKNNQHLSGHHLNNHHNSSHHSQNGHQKSSKSRHTKSSPNHAATNETNQKLEAAMTNNGLRATGNAPTSEAPVQLQTSKQQATNVAATASVRREKTPESQQARQLVKHHQRQQQHAREH